MAKVYASPVDAPEFSNYLNGSGNFDYSGYAQASEDFRNKLRKWLKDNGYNHKLTGKIIRLPWADGAAEYMIMNGTSLIHLPLGDEYQVPEYQTRGLRASDLARMAK